MFNKELHRKLDGEKEHEVRVTVLESFDERLRAFIEQSGWEEPDGFRRILAAGIQALSERSEAVDKPVGEMPPGERMQFLQDRWSRVEAAYSMLQFQAYQVMNQNDALEMNLRGLMPQLEAANERVVALEEEVLRLRALVPEKDHQGDVLVQGKSSNEGEYKSLADRIRAAMGRES